MVQNFTIKRYPNFTVKGPARKDIPPIPPRVSCKDCKYYRPPRINNQNVVWDGTMGSMGSCTLFYNYADDEEVSIFEARSDNLLCGISGYYFSEQVYR